MAGPFSQDFIDSVRMAGDIVQLVSDYVPLKPAGSRMKGLCPFHQEKTPSFSVDPERQLFYCFGCQTGGDLFKFVMLYEKLPFAEAVEMLARRWGVPLPAGKETRSDDPRERLLAMNKAAEAFFRSNLADPTIGSGCRSYLERRRLDSETVTGLGLGYARDSWDGLRSHLVGKRFRPQELLDGGLTLPRKSGSGEYDRFRDRLIFPIRDVGGRIVAFGGRTLGDAQPKYINSPETPAYTKGDHLYGLDLAKEVIRREGFAIVVEGYLDLAALVRSGFANVVASLGTAFTPGQARLLKRYCGRVLFSYDGDSAGSAATARSLDLLLAEGFEVRVVELPGGADPDDFIADRGREAYSLLLRQAPEYLQFLIQREVQQRDLGRIDEQVAAVNAVLPHLAKLTSAIARASWASRLADAINVDDALVLQELRGAVRSAEPRIRERPADMQPPREVEARLVHQLLHSREELECWRERLDLDDLAGTRVQSIVGKILELAREGKPLDYPLLLESLDNASDRDLLTRIAFRDEPEDGSTVEDCLWTFKRRRLAREGSRVRRTIGDLQESQSDGDMDRHLKRIEAIAKQRDALT